MASTEIRELQRSTPFSPNGDGDTLNGAAVSVLHWLGTAGHHAPAYWSFARDRWLRQFYLRSDYLKIAVGTFTQKAYSVPLFIMPRDRSVRAHTALARQLRDDILRNSGMLKGFMHEFQKFCADYCTQDNGAFMLVMGRGKMDGPISGQAMGLMHLDSQRCTRTGNVEYPVIYEHVDGKRYKLHYARVIAMSSMPSADAELFDVGLCAVSRCMDAAQDMLDITTYTAEKLGSRPPRQLLYAKTGATLKQLSDAVVLANARMDAQQLERFARTMLLAPATAAGQLELDLLDLAAAPDGFDREKATIIDVAVIAAAFGLDPRDLAHSFGISGQTKADAEVMHLKTTDKGAALFLSDFAEQLNQKVMPDTLEAYFDYIDDTQDEQAANVRKVRAESRQIDLAGGVLTVRVAREQMLEDGEITEQQFEELELVDGRLADGMDALTLFFSQDGEISRILAGLTDDPLTGIADAAAIDERVRLAWQRHDAAPNAGIKRKMRQALAALERLRTVSQRAEPETPAAQPDEPATDDEEPEPAVKAMRTKQDADLDGLMDEYAGDLDGLIAQAIAGDIEQDEFERELEALVAALLLAALLLGSRRTEDDLDAEIRLRFEERLQVNLDAIPGLADDIYAGRYAEDRLGEEGARRREALWIGALAGMYAVGQVFRRGNPRYRWELGATERHCGTCATLAGQVKTAAEWNAGGYLPRGSNLECGGWRCDCSLVEVS